MASKEDLEEARSGLPELGAKLATELGDGWSASKVHGWRTELHGPDAAVLKLEINEKSATHVVVAGEYPQGARDVITLAYTHITCATFRGPEKIAGDIRRRLLRQYLPELARAQEAIASRDTDDEKRHGVMAELIAAVPELGYPYRDRYDCDSASFSNGPRTGVEAVRVRLSRDGSTIGLRIDGLAPQMLAALLAALGRAA